MFACLYSLSTPPAVLRAMAQDVTPRFEVVGPLVLLDLEGLSRLVGSAQEIGEHLRRAAGGLPIRIAIASSQNAAALVALAQPGLTVVPPEDQAAALALLPVRLIGELESIRRSSSLPVAVGPSSPEGPPLVQPPHVGEMDDVLPYFESCLERTSALVRVAPGGGCGWSHPRHAHAAHHARRAHGGDGGSVGSGPAHAARGTQHTHSARSTQHAALKATRAFLDILHRWGIDTLGALAALPSGEVYERLGSRGVCWQRLARGVDQGPLVPWMDEEPFEAALDLEWPLEGLEPLSFVLARLVEPLADRLERADRGAAVLHTFLRLTMRQSRIATPGEPAAVRQVHARTLQLPAPMRDPKTLRTLVLLDLESHPPPASIDAVRVLIEPTPARVLQWTLFERAQPSPEQVSTLLARLTALMGEGHVGSPRLVDSWKPGAFEMGTFQVLSAECSVPRASAECGVPRAIAACAGSDAQPAPPGTQHAACARSTQHARCTVSGTALRRFRLPVPARVQVQEGRPVRVMTDRRGISSGAVRQAAGPWRTSGAWWGDGGRVGPVGPVGNNPHHPDPPYRPHHPHQAWDRDEWEVALVDGTIYRIFVERDVGQWFIEGMVD